MIVDISTSATKKFFVLYAWSPVRLRNIVIGPNTALAANGSDYYTVKIVKYHDGVETGIAIDERTTEFSTATRSLTVGTPIRLPQVDRMDAWILTDELLYLEVTKVGSPAALAASAQVDVIGGK